MKRQTMIYHKLVRDKIPEIIRKGGAIPKFHTAQAAEIQELLVKKLFEEANELGEKLRTGGTLAEIVRELADVLEILRAIASRRDISWKHVEAERKQRHQERGGFEQGIVLESVQENPDKPYRS